MLDKIGRCVVQIKVIDQDNLLLLVDGGDEWVHIQHLLFLPAERARVTECERVRVTESESVRVRVLECESVRV